jgi:hypothetical protein
MATYCGTNDTHSYLGRRPSSPAAQYVDWWETGDLATASVGLNLGEGGDDGDNASLLARMMRTTAALSPTLPTPAELLSSLLAPGLFIAAESTPFNLVSWNTPYDAV